MSAGNLIVHSGCREVTMDELGNIRCPQPTRTWRPVPHRELVESMLDGLANVGFKVEGTRLAVGGKDDAKLFGIIDLSQVGYDSPDMHFALGLRHANDMSMAAIGVAGLRITVCDNLLFSGDGISFRRKHTSGFRLDRVVPGFCEKYLQACVGWKNEAEDMKAIEVRDDEVKSIIYESVIMEEALPVRLARTVHNLYFNDDRQRMMFPDRTLWSVSNAFTEASKQVKETVQLEYGQRIGRYLARHVRRLRGEKTPLDLEPRRVCLSNVVTNDDVTEEDDV